MRRWNGWGDAATTLELPARGAALLGEHLGAGRALPQVGLEQVLATVPPSRLAPHRLIRTDAQTRVQHARGQSLPDWLAMRSGTFEVFPDGVALPESAADIRELLELAQTRDLVLIARGGGTSVAGHVNPPRSTRPVLVVSLARMNRLQHLDTVSHLAHFGPGACGPEVESQLRAHGYTLGHFPQSWEYSTLGGWVATRSSGQQSLHYGRIEQLFAGGTLETFAGSLRLPTFPASAAGPDVRELVLGSEGRLGILSEVVVRVRPLAADERFHAAVFPAWEAALEAVRELVQACVPLSMLRLSNPAETQTQLALAGHARALAWLERWLALRGVAGAKCLLLFAATGTRVHTRTALALARRVLKRHGAVSAGARLGRVWEHGRFRFPYLREALWQAGYLVDTLETATDWSRVGPLTDALEASLRDTLHSEGERIHVFSHLSHLYPGGSSIYTTFIFRPAGNDSDTLARWRRLKHTASQTILAAGGTISHHHGIGRDHAPYLAAEKGAPAMALLTALLTHADPDQRLNPGALLT